MKIIHNGIPSLNSFLPDQDPCAGNFLPSIYNYICRDTDKSFLYNSLTHMLLLLEEDELPLAEQPVEIPSDGELLSDTLSFLIRKRFLVREGSDEQADYLTLFEIYRGLDVKKQITSYTVLTTTGCNARCFYCFEADFKPVPMSEETADQLVRYIAEHRAGNPVKLRWFGGEPLCNIPVIDRVSAGLKAAGIPFVCSVTSNGLLFSDEIVKRAKSDWHLSSVQITLDGMDEEHNRRKNFKGNHENPFRTILENIQKLVDAEIHVHVRLNFDRDNMDSIEKLLDYLISNYRGNRHISVYPSILFENCSVWNANRVDSEQDFLHSALIRYRDLLSEYGLYAHRRLSGSFKIGHCGANSLHSLTVNPDGRFSVCHNLSDQCTYGSVYEGITDKALYSQWKVPGKLREKCIGCRWLPACTPFSVCPTVHTDCRQEHEDSFRRQIFREYASWSEHLEPVESDDTDDDVMS